MHDRNQTVARVYAAALVGIGRETGSLAAIQDDLIAVRRLFDEDRWFRRFFTSPRIDRVVKWKALSGAFSGKCGRPTIGLLKVLVDKGRESILDGIVDEFTSLKDVAENRLHAHILVAKPLADELRRAIASRLEKSSGRSVVLHERVDESVIGGAAIRVGDRVIDRTLKTKLEALKKQLLAN